MDAGNQIQGYRLSPQQEYLWRHARALAGRVELRFHGESRAVALETAWAKLLREEPLLRVTWIEVPGLALPLQYVADGVHSRWEACDLRGQTAEAQTIAIDRSLATALSVDKPLPARVCLARIAEDEWHFVAAISALCADTASLQQLAIRLAAAIDGEFTPTGDGDQFLHYAQWQRDSVDENTETDTIRAGNQHGAPATSLPYDDFGEGFPEASLALRLPLAEPVPRGLVVEQRLGASWRTTVTAAFSTLLSRLCGTAITIGVEVDGRERFDDLATAVGPFTRGLPLRLSLQDDYRYDEVLQRVRDGLVRLEQRQDAWPVDEAAPVYAIGFVGATADAAVTLAAAPYRLLLLVIDRPDGVVLQWQRDPRAFDADAVICLHRQLETLLQAAIAAPDTTLDKLPLLGPDERRRLLVDFNATACAIDLAARVDRCVAAQALQASDRVAVEAVDGVLSYAELDARANRLAAALHARGPGVGALVGICLRRSLDLAVAMVAIQKIGAAWLPLDPALPSLRIAQIVGDAQCRFVLTQAATVDALGACDADVQRIDLDDDATWGVASTAAVDIATAPDDLAYVMYTSGSTGTPKGVMVTQRGLANYLHWCRQAYPLQAGALVPVHSSIAFDLTVTSLLAPLSCGGTVHLLDEALGLDALPQLIRARGGVALVKITPAHAQWLVSALAPDTLQIDALVIGGENLQARHVAQWRRDYPATRLFNEYGPTETVVGCCVHELVDADLRRAPLPVGKPICNTQLFVLDEARRPLATGQIGELYIGGYGVARGYLGRPELSDDRFVPNPFAGDGQSRLYRSGDLARHRPDGTLEILGRVDDQIKLRGFRIEPAEIEAALCANEAIAQAAVMARTDRSGESVLVAYVVPHAAHELPAPAQLRTQLQALLPAPMVPAHFVRIGALPLSVNGKVDRLALPAWGEEAVSRKPYRAPSTPAERALALLWQALLGLDAVGCDDHFFELGGHSFLLIALIEKLHDAGFHVDARTAFAAPVLSDLAARLEPTAMQRADAVAPNPLALPHETIAPDDLPLITLSQDEIDGIVARTPGGAPNIQDIYPLSPLQEGILFHHFLGGSGDPYLARQILLCPDASRRDALLDAIRQVIARHDILRSAACWEGLARPVQVVLRQAELAVETLPEAPFDAAVEALKAATDQSQLRMDLARAPLIRAYCAPVAGESRSVVGLVFHHLVVDHVSLERIVGEVEAVLLGQAAQLPAPYPFRDFIARLERASTDQHDAYFSARLGDVDEPCAPFGILEIDAADVADEARLDLDAAFGTRLRALAHRCGATPAALFHAAWAQVIGLCSGRRDVVFGTVLSGRHHGAAGATQTLGMFLNTLPLRVALDHGDARALVGAVQQELAELLAHEQASLALAQRASGVDAQIPLFGALINYRFSRDTGDAETRLLWQDMPLIFADERSNYPFTLVVDDRGDAFYCKLMGPRRAELQRVLDYLQRALQLLAAALESAAALPGNAALLGDAEMQRCAWLATGADGDYNAQGATLADAFEAQARRTPQAIALQDHTTQLTYAALNARANRLARQLTGWGARPDDRIVICLARSIESVVAQLAVIKAGAAYLPLDVADPEARLRELIDDSGARIVVTDTAHEDRLPASSTLQVVVLDDASQQARMAVYPDSDPDRRVAPLQGDHLAYVMYTSGSTGKPKGVMIEHRSVLRLSVNNTFAPLSVGDCVAHCANPAFDASTWEIWPALLCGARVHVVSSEDVLDPPRLRAALKQGRVTALWLTVGLFNEYLTELADSFGQLRYLLVGGDVLDPRTIARVLERPQRPGRLINGYGPTETTTFACTHVIEADDTQAARIPIGRPIANTRTYILDAGGEPVPVGVAGELHIGGPGVARGYWNQPELTAQRFIADPYTSDADARLYRTGDRARYRVDGTIEFLGRDDGQVKLRGFRVETGEIEAQLAACEGVRQAHVLVREDLPGDRQLVAYVVGHEAADLDVMRLRQRLAHRLAPAMVPAAIIVLPHLPLTANGKIDRRALRSADSGATAAERSPPEGALESRLAAAWQRVLQRERVARDAHFFDLGGHSLSAVQLVSALRKDLGIDIAIRAVFDHPVLRDLAAAITTAEPSRFGAIATVDRAAPLPLSWSQQRLWLLDRLDETAQSPYHIATGLRLRGELDVTALRAAFARVVHRHEVLRTTFGTQDGQPVQRIAPADGTFALEVLDLTATASDARDSALAVFAQRSTRERFDLERGPLLRVGIAKLSEREHVLLLTQHHIVSDGWSLGVLVREITTLYAAFRVGVTDPLPPLALQYADYAAWQRDWLQDTAMQRQAAYWRNQLANAPALLELPTDRPRPERRDGAGGRVAVELDAALTGALRALAQRHEATLFMVLVAGWSVLMARLSGQDDIVVGMPVANRQRIESEALIGFFVNTLALRVRVTPGLDVAALLREVRATTLGAFAHQDLPFEQVVEIVRPARNLQHNPIFQVMFGLDNTPPAAMATLVGIEVDSYALPHPTTPFDLAVSLREDGDRVCGEIEYASQLFDAGTVVRCAGAFRELLRAMTLAAPAPVDRLALLDAAQRRQLHEWSNPAAATAGGSLSLVAAFAAQAQQRGDAIAVIDGVRRISYRELDQAATRVAAALCAQGVGRGDRVAIAAERSAEMIAGQLGILRAGAAYVPIDPAYPPPRIAAMLGDCRPAALLVHEPSAQLVAAGVPRLLIERIAWADRGEAAAPADCGDAPQPDDLAYLIYTSGSTGAPKGVMLEHRNVLPLVVGNHYASVGAGDCVAYCASPAFDAAAWETWFALLNGASLLVVPQATLLDPPACATLLAEHAVSVLHLTVGLLNQYAATCPEIFPRLRCLLFGGEQADAHVVHRIRGAHAPQQLIHCYGPTECTTFAITDPVQEPGSGRRLPIGKPLAHASVRILDANGTPVPIGVAGEIHIGGAAVGRGYWNQPELTAERFVADEYADAGARLYRTGDLGRWLSDGRIEYLGRNDFQFKLRGYRVEPAEIETAALATGEVREALATGYRDERGELRLVLYVVPAAEREVSPAMLRRALAVSLPEHLVPSSVVHLDAFPLTPHGKIDRAALPPPAFDVAAADYVAPQGATETALAALWGELLQRSHVSRHDQFFELGGHSLLVILLIERLRALGHVAEARMVFAAPVLAALAQQLDTARQAKAARQEIRL